MKKYGSIKHINDLQFQMVSKQTLYHSAGFSIFPINWIYNKTTYNQQQAYTLIHTVLSQILGDYPINHVPAYIQQSESHTPAGYDSLTAQLIHIVYTHMH